MEIKEKKIITPRTARYFVLNQYSNEVEEVVFVLHGYAQLAKYFIKKFESIVSNNRIVIAPEGLSKFYWNGMGGRVVASWMTKEDRESEIIDQSAYLDSVYKEIKTNYPQAKIKMIGFSQGASTAVRWLVNSHVAKIDELILWGGAYPFDALKHQEAKRLAEIPTTYLIGDTDQYLKKEDVQNGVAQIEKALNNKIKLIDYVGDHNIFEEPLLKLFNI